MAYDRIIDSAALESNLTAVADAIRAKGGTNAALAFPDGFVRAIGMIEAGSGGSGNAVQIGQNTIAPSFLNLFYALENGTAKTGEFTLAVFLPNTETLIFDSGLDEIKGIFYVDADYAYSATGSVPEYGAWGLYMIHPDGLADVQACGLATFDSNNGLHKLYTGFIPRGSYRIDGGALYVTATYNNHENYTPFCKNHRYAWAAW